MILRHVSGSLRNSHDSTSPLRTTFDVGVNIGPIVKTSSVGCDISHQFNCGALHRTLPKNRDSYE